MKLTLLALAGIITTGIWGLKFEEFAVTTLGTTLGLSLIVFYGLFIALEMSWKYGYGDR